MNKGNNIEKIITEFKRYNSDEKSRSILTVNILLICVLIILFTGLAFMGGSGLLLQVILSFALFWIIHLYVLMRFRNYNQMSVLSSVVINFLMLPIFFLLTKGIYGGMAFCFPMGVIVTFFLIGESYVYILSFLELAFYIYLFVFSYIHEEIILQINDNVNNAVNVIINFALAGFFPIFIFIYQHKIYEDKHKNVVRSYRMIEDARKNKSRFMSNMAQEIRMPMNAIIGMNEIILRDESDPVTHELSMQIKNSSKQLLKIINNFVEYSKLDNNKLELYPDLFSFKELISGIIETFSNEYINEKKDFLAYINPNIPSKLYGDEKRIKQVFMYLLFATVGKSNNNRISLTVDSKTNASTNMAHFDCRISISGDGLSENEIEAMMSAYSKYDSRLKSEYKIMGLEILICRELLEQMNGSLNIQSIKGIGSAIDFSFDTYIISSQPMIRIKTDDNPIVLIYATSIISQNAWVQRFKDFKASVSFVDGPNAFKKAIEERSFSQIFIPCELYDILKDTIIRFDIEKRVYVVSGRNYIYGDFDKCRIIYNPLTSINISEALNGVWDESKFNVVMQNEEVIFPEAKVLIVDDSVVNLKVLSGILRSYKIKSDLSQNADEALKYIDKKFYDLIILDQIMPDVDGIELLHQIRNLSNTNNKTPIICATADFGQEVGRRLMAEGFCDYLAKPVQQFYLERILRKYLPRELAQKPTDVVNNVDESKTNNQNNRVNTEIDPTLVDFEKGCEATGGSKDAYAAILNSYYKEGLKKLEDVKNELASDKIDLYIIDVHALKSSSAAIGAKGISEKFKALEFAGREDKKDFLINNTEETLNLFDIVLKKVREYLVNENLFEDDILEVEKTGDVEELDIDIVMEMLDAISKVNLKKCEEIINELNSKNFGTECNSLILNIKNSYDMFDYPGAKTLMQQLADQINGKK